MDIKSAIKGRRSIRKYSDKKVSMEDVADIIDIARLSPSSGNMQNWKIVVVSDPEVRLELAKAAKKQDWMADAPVHLVICNEYSEVCTAFGELGKMFSIQNCAILTTNIINLAHAEGLGTCWVGSFPSDSVKRVLDLPEEGVDPEVIITLGYSADEPDEQERKDIFDISYFDKWGNTEAKFGEKFSLLQKLKELFKKKEPEESNPD